MMVRVKICGLTNLEDALAAVECGADAVGFVFAPSARRVSPEVVRDIVAQLPPLVAKVGVFADERPSEVLRILAHCGLDLAQLHGNEPADDCEALFPRVIKCFTPETLPPPGDLHRYRVSAFMLDRAKGASRRASLDALWERAVEVGKVAPVILAGGLSPENVARAIEVARPYAVDVASGVEREPGRKDHARLRAFVAAAKAAPGIGLPSGRSGRVEIGSA